MDFQYFQCETCSMSVPGGNLVGGLPYLGGLGLAPRKELVKLRRAPREVVAKVVEPSGRVLRAVGVLAVQQELLIVEPPRDGRAPGSCLAVDLVLLCAVAKDPLRGEGPLSSTRGEGSTEV